MGKSILEIGLAFTLVLVKVGQLESKAVEYVYTGDACECPRDLPYEVGIPVIKANLPPTPKEHNYRIEIPSIHRAKVQYSLDFQVEEPKPPVPPPKLPGTELIARVDRITVPRPDCQTLINKPCTCHMAEGNYPFFNSCPLHDAIENKENVYSVPINYLSNRLKRDIYGKELKQKKDVSKTDKKKMKHQTTFKKTKRVAGRKTHLKKREITEELDHLKKDYSKTLDMRAPEILQFMPEVLSPDFERERCFACDNRNENRKTENYQYNNNIITSCQPKVTPVQLHCKPNYVEYVQGFPVSYEPRNNVLYDQPEQRYVYDRLGHKYKENNGSLKLIHPTKEENYDPIVGNPMNYDRNMDNLIRDIVNAHPEFISASDHGDGVLTTSIETQRHDTRAYIRRLIGDRMSKMLHKRYSEHYQTDYSYEDDSYENPKYRPDLIDIRSEPNFSFEENDLDALHGADKYPQAETEETNKSNVHFLKFKKDGKILEILTSNKNETYHDDV